MKKISYFACRFVIIAILLACSLHVSAAAEEKVAVPTEKQKTTFIDLYSWASILPKELIDLQNRIAKDKKITSIEGNIPQLIAETEAIRWDTTIAQTNPDIQPFQVTNLQEKTQRLEGRLKNITEPINALISFWSDSRKQWITKKEQILAIEQHEDFPLMLGVEQHAKLVDTVNEALLIVETHLKSVLSIGKKIGDMQIILYSIDSDLQSLDIDIKETFVQQTSPSMLSNDFYSLLSIDMVSKSYEQTKQFFWDRSENLQNNLRYLLVSCFGFALICFAIGKTKDLISSDSHWQPFAKRPIATAIFMCSSVNAIANIFPLNTNLTEQWEALLHVLTLIAVMRLTKHLMLNRVKRKLLNQLTFFLSMSMILFLLDLPRMVVLLYVFYVSIVAFLYYLFKLPSTRGKNFSDVWKQRGWGIFPAVIIVSGLIGYNQLAIIVFSTLLSAIIGCLVIWVLYRLHLGLLELILSLLPFTLIKENFSDIIQSIQPVIRWLHIVILITLQSVIWDIYPTIPTAFVGINNFGFDFAGLHISFKFILTVVIVFYGAFITSKAIQALLLKNILPRYKAEKGVQLSITRLAHYAILACGFLIMLRVLGFQLNQITLLGGALGVGIGFGLQAIVNNFASGLILLFERPIKVGDTIQLGSEWGEVKQLGLRATIIQTFDNAEIVVPNSDLVTGQVTNWTLGDRRVRVKIPIGVAYGTDVSKVMEILETCGNANPMVLSHPKPSALFLAFGTSSLDFELRVWIPEFLDKLQVLSDLNQDIDNEFSMNNIEIPFPQSDLHLRSVDDEAADQIRRNTQLTEE
ncbi:hypothetical protein LA52FAK_19110 [Desulforhopalus sp. 52FAK]